MYEYGVVGSGVGGSVASAYLNKLGYKVILFEKAQDLGGCSSSFKRKGFRYNTGATTFAGYQDGFVVKEMLDKIGVKPNIIKTDPTIVVIQNGKTTPRYQDFERFLAALEKNYPNQKNKEFWKLIYKINKSFYRFNNYYYSNKNSFSKYLSLLSYLPVGIRFGNYLFKNSFDFIDKFYGGVDKEYFEFLEAQIMIVAQSKTKEINFLTAALALGYTFNDNYYVMGGFSKLFDEITKDIEDVKTGCEIKSIERKDGYFELKTKKESFKAKKVILNSTIYDSSKLFLDADVKDYCKKYEKLDNHQSSFMLYLTIKSDRDFYHHYQIIKNENFKHTISNALFVSFSDKDDNEIVKEGYYSITASIHTDARFLENKDLYKIKKNQLQKILLDTILNTLDIDESCVVDCFSATPNTFFDFINRKQLGGNAMSIKNFLLNLPSNDTPIAGLYSVGDSVYPAQGWPGVVNGVRNLTRLLDA
ncbi:MAG: NAD(P)-binding protein [Campylobacterales bacterium]|nr:NAD(P)-binding protein [Campylobacterales bacterium]